MENEEIRKKFITTSSDESNDEFDIEAKEGWKGKELSFENTLNKLDKRIDEIYRNEEKKGKIIKPFFWVKYAAATLIIGVSALLSASYFDKTNSGNELFAANFEPLKNDENITRGNENNVEILTWEQKANADYQKGNYIEAQKNYEKTLEIEPNNSKTMVFLAISYLSTEKPQKAIELLNKYVPEGNSYDEDIQWFLALAYLKLEQKGTAKLLLEGLRDKKGYYKNQAEIILSKL